MKSLKQLKNKDSFWLVYGKFGVLSKDGTCQFFNEVTNKWRKSVWTIDTIYMHQNNIKFISRGS